MNTPNASGLTLGAALLLSLSSSGCSGCGGAPAEGTAASSAAVASASASATVSPSSSAPSPKEPKPPWVGIDGPVAPLQATLDPKKVGPYTGPTATLRGKITIKGDAPPVVEHAYPKECPLADNMYGKLFRVGEKGALADALVGVTGFDGFVPAKTDVVEVKVNGCAFETRTVALTLGQRLDVRNVDRDVSYTPFLDGSAYSALRVAVPRGPLVPLSARKPGQYLLRDAMLRPFMLADVFVLKYATVAVTRIDGAYEIAGIPVGKVRVDAFLPVIRKGAGKDFELKEGDNVLDLELAYDAKKDKATPVPPPEFGTRRQPTAGSASPSSAPAPTPSAAP